MHYFDASAIAKRYVYEQGSVQVQRLISADVPATSRLSEVEVASALGRRAREGKLSLPERDATLIRLKQDFTAFHVVELTPELAGRASVLVQRHDLRAGDAIHLASCLYLQEQLGEETPLVAFDARLIIAARLEGLSVM